MPITIFDTRTMLPPLLQAKMAAKFLLDTFFPTILTFGTEYVDIDKWDGKRRLAPFVSPISEGVVMENIGFTTQSIKPPYVKPKMVTTAEHILARGIGQPINPTGVTPQQKAQAKLGMDLIELRDTIVRREEWMASQLLQSGKVAIVGKGFDAEIDYGMKATHQIVLAGADLWTAATGKPLKDMRDWARLAGQDSGKRPDVAVFGSEAVDAFLANVEVAAQLDNRRIVLGQIVQSELPDGVTYWGNIQGIDIYSYDEWYIDDTSGLEVAMVPVDMVFLGSTSAKTSRSYGAIMDMNAIDAGLIETPYYPRSWMTDDPAQRWLMLQSAPLVQMNQVDAFIVATVV